MHLKRETSTLNICPISGPLASASGLLGNSNNKKDNRGLNYLPQSDYKCQLNAFGLEAKLSSKESSDCET